MKTKPRRPVLKRGAVYLSDNGRAICVHCAGSSALYTGRDISGQRVWEVPMADRHKFKLHCECGRDGGA